MNGSRYYYGVRVEGAKIRRGLWLGARHRDLLYPTTTRFLWAIIHGILGWLYVIYVATVWVIQPQADRDFHSVAKSAFGTRRQQRRRFPMQMHEHRT